MSITLGTTLSRSGDVLHAAVSEEEAVMMSVETGRYYSLNAVGLRVWELLETPKTVTQLCQTVHAEFDIDEATSRDDVLKFAEDMIANGIVHEVAP